MLNSLVRCLLYYTFSNVLPTVALCSENTIGRWIFHLLFSSQAAMADNARHTRREMNFLIFFFCLSQAAMDKNARHTRDVEEKISQLKHQASTKKVDPFFFLAMSRRKSPSLSTRPLQRKFLNTHTHTHTHTPECVWMCVCVYVCVCVCVCVCVLWLCVCEKERQRLCLYLCLNVNVFVQTDSLSHTHKHKHTHKYIHS
jgi:hypothetical protein